MRAAFVTNICAHYRLPLFEELSRRHELDFFFTSRGDEWYWSKDHAVDTGSLRARQTPNPLDLALALARGRYDCAVLSLADRRALPVAFATAKALRLPIVLWVGIWQHPGTRFHRLTRPLTRSLYRAAGALAVYGTHVGDYVRRESGRERDIVVVPQAMDLTAFTARVPDSRLEAIRSRLKLEGPTAVFVGRLEAEKGLDVLLEALKLAPTVRTLLLVGSGSLEASIAADAERLGVAERVRLAGYVPQAELPAYLQACDFLVLPSVTTRAVRETWGFVVNEAMAAGLPVVATDAVGAAAGGLVLDGHTGAVVPERDAPALAVAMDRLADDVDLREAAAVAAVERVARWSYDAAADAFDEALRLAARPRARTRGDARPARS